MELYEYARPGLFAGKKILYVHGFASSGASGTVGRIRLLLPQATVIAPDLPVDPFAAIDLLKELCAKEQPDLIIGTSMGGMYTEQLAGFDRICVNPALHLADTILKNNGLGKQEFHSTRQDGQTSFMVTKALVEDYRTVSDGRFSVVEPERVWGLFGTKDTMVNCFDEFAEHYPQALHLMVEMDGVLRDVRNDLPIGEAFKVFHKLSEMYDTYIVCREGPNKPELWGENVKWAEAHIGVPAWNRVIVGNHPELLMGDYLLTREGCDGFMGTVLTFGEDPLRTWADVATFFSRLGGQ